MNITAERKKTDAVLDFYRNMLDTVTEERFTETPGGGWSYAEVYSHIMQATLASTIALERCTHKSCKPTNDRLNWMGRSVLFFGMFPPLVRIKEPAKVAEKMPALKISKEEARNYIIKCRQRLDEMVEKINDAENEGRVKHPRLGMLNAGQWLKFIRIHLSHHVKQLKRIQNKF